MRPRTERRRSGGPFQDKSACAQTEEPISTLAMLTFILLAIIVLTRMVTQPVTIAANERRKANVVDCGDNDYVIMTPPGALRT